MLLRWSGGDISQQNNYFSEMESSSTLFSLLSFLAVILRKYVVLNHIFQALCVSEFRLFVYILIIKYFVQRVVFSVDSQN